jgi:hypothetical protein
MIRTPERYGTSTMTSQEMINDSVAQSIRQPILSMLVCWQRLQETFSNQESVGLLRSVKVESKVGSLFNRLIQIF